MRQIPFSPPTIRDEDIELVISVLRSGWITSGEKNSEFSQKLTEYSQAHHTVLANSATASMFIALKSMGIGEGDEVITTPYTFAATANVIVHTGAKVVFADIEKDSFYIDPQKIYQKISPKTKAIIPVDFSSAKNWIWDEQILAKNFQANNVFQEQLARPLILIDSAHSLGSRFMNSHCDMAAFSFHAVKNLTTAEGGALSLNNFLGDLTPKFIQTLNRMVLHGQNRSAKEKFLQGSWEYDIEFPGYKFNMTDIAAALGLSQLKRFSEILDQRRLLSKYYVDQLKTFPNILMHDEELFYDIQRSSCHLMPIRIDNLSETNRNQLIQNLANKGISTNVHYKPLTMMSAKKYYDTTPCPNSEAQYQNQITLPLHLSLTFDDIDYIIQELKREILS